MRIVRNTEDIAMGAPSNIRIESECFTLNGELTNSGEYDGLTSEEARKKMTQWLVENKIGFKISHIEVGDIDFLKDSVMLDIYYVHA